MALRAVIFLLLLVPVAEAKSPPSWSVRVLCYDDDDNLIDSKGSGSLIAAQYVITNHHVIKDAKRVFVRFPDFNHVECEIVKKDAKTDLALLKTAALTYKQPAPLAAYTQKGQDVFIYGYGQGLVNHGWAKITRFYQRERGDDQYPLMWCEGHAAVPGDSGGPIMDNQNKLVGVTFGSNQEENATGGIRIEWVLMFSDEFVHWKGIDKAKATVRMEE